LPATLTASGGWKTSFFSKDTIWRMYGTDGKLLSGIPIHEIGMVKKGDTARRPAPRSCQAIEIMPLGKYKGERIQDVPADYRRWVLENFSWTPANMNLKTAIQASM
jgi:DNA repair protein RadD